MGRRAVCHMEPAASVALLLWWHPSIFLANALPLRNRALGAFHTIGGDETSVYEPLPADSPEFAWGDMPGRCCIVTNRQWGLASPAHAESACNTCAGFGSPTGSDSFCHLSAAHCEDCGSNLFCPPPPRLVAGNVVCEGASRVGTGCSDEYTTGVCMESGVDDCNIACLYQPGCKLFTFYPRERMGTCILCHDGLNMAPTPEHTTRVYNRYNVKPPPPPPHAYMDAKVKVDPTKKFKVLKNPPPPLPPRPAHSPPVGVRQFTCSYFPETELQVNLAAHEPAVGYQELTFDDRADCCNACGATEGCADFVYEEQSGTCALLAQVSDRSRVVPTPNKFTISGSVTKENFATTTGTCEVQANTGFAYGEIESYSGMAIVPAAASDMSNDEPIKTVQDCCDKCASVTNCAKFTFAEGSRQCALYEAIAQQMSVSSNIAGVVSGRAHLKAPPSYASFDVAAAGAAAAVAPNFEHYVPPVFPKWQRFPAIKPVATESSDAISGLSLANTLYALLMLCGVAGGAYVFCFPSARGKQGRGRKRMGRYEHIEGPDQKKIGMAVRLKVGTFDMVSKVDLSEDLRSVEDFEKEIYEQITLLEHEDTSKLAIYYLASKAGAEVPQIDEQKTGERWVRILKSAVLSKAYHSKKLLVTEAEDQRVRRFKSGKKKQRDADKLLS